MSTVRIAIFVAAAVFVVAATSSAHKGHAHKVMGTISSIDGRQLTVKATDGKTVLVMLDAKTTITQGRNKVAAAALKIGDRVVAEGPEEKKMIMAATVKVGEAAPTPAKK